MSGNTLLLVILGVNVIFTMICYKSFVLAIWISYLHRRPVNRIQDINDIRFNDYSATPAFIIAPRQKNSIFGHERTLTSQITDSLKRCWFCVGWSEATATTCWQYLEQSFQPHLLSWGLRFSDCRGMRAVPNHQ
jgi:hypothetical protein